MRLSLCLTQFSKPYILGFKKFQEVTSKTVREKITLLMLQFLAFSVRLADINNLVVDSDKYLLEVLTKFSVGDLSNTFDMMLHQERVKKISSVVSMLGDSLSTLVKIKSNFKLTNTSYLSLFISGTFNVTTAIFILV